ncbi:Leucine-rich PPR motif-containing protein, mitochondrial [Chionoecetes opilio]|uniref:Leucine-rich PPR motif-containing protein, mitochondrial n=1 Tax=Chionoecetes opilio TaxID=41210 RepID=A0A8J4XKS2_CHIOP|nr:Leucine-rich PPR motif-containing protein, mitochondrial [Chionoecetes opilio]
MLAGRLGLVLLMGHGHATAPGVASALPLLCAAFRNTSQGATRWHARVTHRPLTHVALYETTNQKKDSLLSSCHIGFSENTRLISDGNGTSANKSRVESNLSELRMKLERLGHLNLNDMSQVVKALEQCLEDLSDADCLRLLQFCCRMAEEEYRPCGSLIQRVWRLTTDRHSGKVNQEHLELYLHLCLIVQSTNISEREIIEKLESHRIEPNAQVFEKLMMALGQRGHLDGALQVLAMMKECRIAVREATFAALIRAYGVNHDWEGVQGVLDTMRSVHVSPSEATFGALAVVCGVMGQVSKIKQVVFQAGQEGVILSASQLEAVLLALIRNGHAGDHHENIDFMLRLIEESGMKPDLSRLALHLIHCGRVREAVHLLLSLPLLRTNNHLYSNGATYLREIVHARTDPHLVVEVCHRLQKEGINGFPLQVALEHALRERWEELAWVLLRAMKEAGLPLREHYFWPLLHLKAIDQQPAELLECVKAMIQLGEVPGFATLSDHVIPGMSLSQPCLALQMLQNVGLSATTAATPLLVVLVKNNMMEHAIKFVQETKAPFSVGDAIRTLASAWHSSPKSILALLALLLHRRQEQQSSKNTDDWGGQFLLSLAATRAGLAVHLIRPLFQELRRHRIGVSEHSADLLTSQFSQPLQEAVRDNLPLVLQAGQGQPPQDQNSSLPHPVIPHPSNMKEEELEGHIEELRSKGLNTRGSLRRLLLLRASKNDKAGVLQLMQSASEEGQRPSAGMLSSVLMAYVNNGNTEAALDMLFRLATEYPNFTVDSYKIVDLCTLLTQSGRAPEAMEILQDYIMKSNENIVPKQLRRNCRNLLMASAGTSKPEETEKLFDALLLGGFVRPDSLSLGPLVKSRLNRLGDASYPNDIDVLVLKVQ